MLSLRIVTATAVFLTFAASNASAQTATTTAPGKPLQLFQVIQQKDDTAAVNPHHRARYVHRRVARTHVANQTTGAMRHALMEVQPAPEPEQTAATQLAAIPPTITSAAAATLEGATPAAATPAAITPAVTTAPAPANIWPAPDLTLPGVQTQTLTLTPPSAPTAASNEPAAAANSNEMLTGAYHTVQVTPPSPAQATAPDTAQVTPPNAVDPADIAADHQHVAANSARPNDATATWPEQHVMVVTAEPQSPNPVGSVSWIAHVLAALVGALAAGTLAWVLIDPLPARSYE